MVEAWSTADVHPRDRLAWWVDRFSAACHLDCEPRRGAGFFGKAALVDAGPLQIGTGATSAQVLTRSPRQIALGDNRFYLTLISSGRGLFSQDGREALLRPGDFVLSDRARPYRFSHDSDVAQTVLMMPRRALLRRIGSAERFTSLRIDGGEGFGALLSPMLQNLAGQLPGIAAAAQARVAENVFDLIATALLSAVEETTLSAGMTHVRIKFWIETHLSEELSGEQIAAACGVSVRHINRLFAREETSLIRYVWERRLAGCRRALTDPTMRHRPIGEIALAAGFKDLSHFSRAYRARYGRTAREDRASGEAAPASPA
jgi:AraC family transcriptional activator of tynA and feaB